MSKNKNLRKAKRNKNDEFYTQLIDIENELRHYKKHFEGKVVYCNCDDPSVSNFFKYFSDNFHHLKLKKLITTCYKNKQRDLFSQHKDLTGAKVLIYEGDKNNNRFVDPEEIGTRELKGDGDFRSDECIELLKEADIVVTNPPFSLFREYISQLIEFDKKFLVIGNLNALTYKEIFPLIRNNKLWLGPSISSGDREFGVPDDYPIKTKNWRIDEDGKKYFRVSGVRWFTNLDHYKRKEKLFLYKKYSPKEYQEYENYNAINVGKTIDIPKDYKGYIGVPITFLDKYNPNQFEIIGLGIANLGLEIGIRPYTDDHKKYRKEVQKRGVVDGDLYFVENGIPKVPYARVIIKNRNVVDINKVKHEEYDKKSK